MGLEANRTTAEQNRANLFDVPRLMAGCAESAEQYLFGGRRQQWQRRKWLR